MDQVSGDAIALRRKRIDELVDAYLEPDRVDRQRFRAELRTLKAGLSNYAGDEVMSLIEYLRDQAVAFDTYAENPTKDARQFRTASGVGLGIGAGGVLVLALGATGVGGIGLAACGALIAYMSRGEGEALQSEADLYRAVAQDFRDVADEIGARDVG
ncbi:MAG: hypothetical protein AAF899_17500 [Pseudomonadota bacterium]